MSATEQDGIEDLVVDTASDRSSEVPAMSSNSTTSSTLSCSDSNDHTWSCTPDADDSGSSCSIIVDDDCVIVDGPPAATAQAAAAASLQPRRNPKRRAKQFNYRKKRFESMFDYYTTTVAAAAAKNEQRQSRCSRRLKKLERSSRNRNLASQGGLVKKYRVISSPTEMQEAPAIKARPHCTVSTRSATRRMWAEGCVLVQPAAEDAWQLRTWPVEGMHERPVWPDPRHVLPEDDCTPRRRATQLERAAHEALHAVLAFCAQVCRGGAEEASLQLSGAGDNKSTSEQAVANTSVLQRLASNFSSDFQNKYAPENYNPMSEGSDGLKAAFSSRIRDIALECSNILATSHLGTHRRTSSLGSGDHLVECKAATAHVQDPSCPGPDLSTSPGRAGSPPKHVSPVSVCSSSDNVGHLEGADRPIDLSNTSGAGESNEAAAELRRTARNPTAAAPWHKDHLYTYECEIPLDLRSEGHDEAQPPGFLNREALQELIHSTLLLYCSVCSVSQKALADYIDSLTTASLLEWLNESIEQ